MAINSRKIPDEMKLEKGGAPVKKVKRGEAQGQPGILSKRAAKVPSPRLEGRKFRTMRVTKRPRNSFFSLSAAFNTTDG